MYLSIEFVGGASERQSLGATQPATRLARKFSLFLVIKTSDVSETRHRPFGKTRMCKASSIVSEVNGRNSCRAVLYTSLLVAGSYVEPFFSHHMYVAKRQTAVTYECPACLSAETPTTYKTQVVPVSTAPSLRHVKSPLFNPCPDLSTCNRNTNGRCIQHT